MIVLLYSTILRYHFIIIWPHYLRNGSIIKYMIEVTKPYSIVPLTHTVITGMTLQSSHSNRNRYSMLWHIYICTHIVHTNTRHFYITWLLSHSHTGAGDNKISVIFNFCKTFTILDPLVSSTCADTVGNIYTEDDGTYVINNPQYNQCKQHLFIIW